MYPIQVIKRSDKEYPTLLKEVNKPPALLYVRGNIELLNGKMGLAIVGTRKCSTYGKSTTKNIIQDLAIYDIVIVSGLALGIDTEAHRNALENNLPTIAVLGGSVDDESIYPQHNKGLATKILENNGLIISEYKKGTETFPSNFLERNRIIAGITQGTLVVEAPKKSGALSTARHALEANRSVFAIPGNIDSHISEGANYLIQQGALCTTKANDIIEDFQMIPSKNNHTNILNDTLDPQEEVVISILSSSPNPVHIDSITENANIDKKDITRILINLSLTDQIQEVEQNYYKIYNNVV